jgi:hypothetical protein
MGKMSHGFDCSVMKAMSYSDRLYTVQKLAEVRMSKPWWTYIVHKLGVQLNILIKLLPSYY